MTDSHRSTWIGLCSLGVGAVNRELLCCRACGCGLVSKVHETVGPPRAVSRVSSPPELCREITRVDSWKQEVPRTRDVKFVAGHQDEVRSQACQEEVEAVELELG